MTIEKLGPYRIDRIVGHGGMGTVYAGTHMDTGERAAIKVLSEALSADPRFRERFQAEVESLKRLRHPNIVTLFGYGAEEGRLFFTMELVEGPSIEAQLRSGERFGWKRTARTGVQICAALKHAHDHGIIHRDLKPGNLLLAPDGSVKLTDFGIAKSFGGGGLTLAGSMIGTPEYMAPEQTEGAAATPRSDLYSLGCVLYAMLVGEPPFWSPVITKLIDRVRHEPPPRLRLRVDDVPAEFDRLIGQLLAKQPEERIATPQLLANLLQAMLHALPSDTLHGHLTSDQPAPEAGPAPDTRIESPADGATGEHSGKDPDSSERQTLDFSVTDQRRKADDDLSLELAGPETSSHEVTTPGGFSSEDAAEDPGGTRYTTVSKAEWQGVISRDTAAGNKRREILVMVAIVAALATMAGLFAYVLSPPSADRLYRQITAAEDPTGDDCGQLLDEFLQRYPDDPRTPDVQQRFEAYQCEKLRRDLQGKLRSLTESEQLYLDGLDHLAAGRPDQAAECFRRILESHKPATAGVLERKLAERAEYLLVQRLGDPPRPPADK